MTVSEMLQDVQFVVDTEGNKRAALPDFRLWEVIVEYMEAHEDDPAEDLTALPEFADAVRLSVQRVKSGDFVRYEDIRRDV